MKKVTLAVGALLFALAAVVAPTHAQRPNDSASAVAQAVAEGRASATELLIQFRPSASAADRERARGWVNAQRRELLRGGSGELELAVIPAGQSVDNAIAVLAQHPAVAFAEPNWIYAHQDTSNDPYFNDGSLWGMYGDGTTPSNAYGSGAGEAWAAGTTGSSTVIVGVIDEGIDYNHPDLAANIWTNPYDPADGVDNDGNGYVDDLRGWDFVSNNNSVYDGSSSRLSVDAHGTHVSGTIGGVGGNGAGVAGVNWNVTIISAKFLGTRGGTTANAIKAVDYFTDLKTRHGLNLVATNNSWGGGGYSQGLHDAIIRGANAGILFVAAAGNSTTNNDTTSSYPSNYRTTVGTSTQSPAGFDAVIAVAALCGSSASSYCAAGAGTLASFSSYGATTVDLAAPGVSIYSTTPGNGYSSYNGTSMATPHVTGAAALYASMHPGTSAADIRTAILAAVTPTATLAGKTTTGGRLNIGAWIGSTSVDPPDAPSLTVQSVADAQVTLAWGAVTGAESYTVLRSTQTGGPYSALASGVSSLSYVDTATASGTYYYVIQAVKSGVSSANSNEVDATVTVAPPTAPDAPANLVAQTPKGKKQIGLSWTGSAGATSYRIYRKMASDPDTAFAYTGSVTGTSAVNSGLQSGVTYTYYVTAMSTLESGPSNEDSATAR